MVFTILGLYIHTMTIDRTNCVMVTVDLYIILHTIITNGTDNDKLDRFSNYERLKFQILEYSLACVYYDITYFAKVM